MFKTMLNLLLLLPCLCVCVCVRIKLLSPRLTLCDPMDCSPPGSSVRGILQQECWSGLPQPPPEHQQREDGAESARPSACLVPAACPARITGTLVIRGNSPHCPAFPSLSAQTPTWQRSPGYGHSFLPLLIPQPHVLPFLHIELWLECRPCSETPGQPQTSVETPYEATSQGSLFTLLGPRVFLANKRHGRALSGARTTLSGNTSRGHPEHRSPSYTELTK